MRLDDLEKLEAAATPRPWVYSPQLDTVLVGYSPQDKPDDELTVAARNAIPDLLAIARAAEAHVDAYDAAEKTINKWIDYQHAVEASKVLDQTRDALRAALAKLEGGGT